MNEEQIRQIIREEIINTLGFSSSIPLEVDLAFRDRFKNIFKTFVPQSVTDINATDRDQTTSAGGGDSVPQTFTDLKKVLDPDTSSYIYLPYYT